MKITLTIDTKGAAFGNPDPTEPKLCMHGHLLHGTEHLEVARLLKTVAKAIENRGFVVEHPLFDLNGRECGSLKCEGVAQTEEVGFFDRFTFEDEKNA